MRNNVRRFFVVAALLAAFIASAPGCGYSGGGGSYGGGGSMPYPTPMPKPTATH